MTEKYLEMFEEAIKKQADLVGIERALWQAKQAGLGVSGNGHIVSCAGNPMVVLLRLIRIFCGDNNMAALLQCTPLIDEMERIAEHLKPEPEAIES